MSVTFYDGPDGRLFMRAPTGSGEFAGAATERDIILNPDAYAAYQAAKASVSATYTASAGNVALEVTLTGGGGSGGMTIEPEVIQAPSEAVVEPEPAPEPVEAPKA